MMEPREIGDEGHERIVERVAAIDVAKAAGMVCVRVPHESRPGRRVSRVWEVAATTGEVTGLGDHLACQGAGKVSVEPASDYWRIWFYLLEAAGLDVRLVNAREARNMPGRPKTGRPGGVWLARCTGRGVLRPSFVPPAGICMLRDYTRLRTGLTQERTRYYARLEKLLEDALIKVPAVAGTMTTKPVRDMIEALIAGERSPRALADLARGRMTAKRAALIEALTGRSGQHHAELARMLLDQIDALSAQIGTLTGRIEELTGASPPPAAATPTGPPAPERAPARARPSSRRWRAWMRSPVSRWPARRASSPR